ncbi:hypothetical protein ASF61_14880 [Duganella sp. Leaf126]|nr:hypothetical protein ASF61_14880 [Duganella sp. Leaf126]
MHPVFNLRRHGCASIIVAASHCHNGDHDDIEHRGRSWPRAPQHDAGGNAALAIVGYLLPVGDIRRVTLVKSLPLISLPDYPRMI